jgi:hypothetical protein
VKKVVVAGALVLLAVLGTRARAESSVPRYDVDGACAAYVDGGLSPLYQPGSVGGLTRNEAISFCVEWEQGAFNQVKEKWQTAPPATRTACVAQVKEKIGWWNKTNEAWGYDWLRDCLAFGPAPSEPSKFKYDDTPPLAPKAGESPCKHDTVFDTLRGTCAPKADSSAFGIPKVVRTIPFGPDGKPAPVPSSPQSAPPERRETPEHCQALGMEYSAARDLCLAPEPDYSHTQEEILRMLKGNEPRKEEPRKEDELHKLAALMREQFMACFRAPPGARIKVLGPRRPVITVRFADPSGALEAQPVIEYPPSDPGGLAIVEALAQAVARCAPYRIPKQYAQYFEQWKDVTIPVSLREFEDGGSAQPAPEPAEARRGQAGPPPGYPSACPWPTPAGYACTYNGLVRTRRT